MRCVCFCKVCNLRAECTGEMITVTSQTKSSLVSSLTQHQDRLTLAPDLLSQKKEIIDLVNYCKKKTSRLLTVMK